MNLPETGHSHLLCVGSRVQQAVVEGGQNVTRVTSLVTWYKLLQKLPKKYESDYYFLRADVSCWAYLRDFNITNSSYPGEKDTTENHYLF